MQIIVSHTGINFIDIISILVTIIQYKLEITKNIVGYFNTGSLNKSADSLDSDGSRLACKFLHMCNGSYTEVVADVALTKHHQRLNKIIKIFTCTSSKSCLKKLCHAIYVLNTQHNPVRTAYACALVINMGVSHSKRL